MNTPLSIQNFSGHNVRVFGTPDAPLFVAADVAKILDIANPREVIRSFPQDEKAAVRITDTSLTGVTQARELTALTEPGLYRLIFRSNKPNAEDFRRWVFHEVLPAIRKAGIYQQKELSRRDILKLALEAEERVAELETDVERMRPKEILYDVAMASDGLLNMSEVAKLLGTGERRLFRFLREQKILRDGTKERGSGGKYAAPWHNTPYQQYTEAGYFKVVEFPSPTRTHGVHITLTTKVYQKGVCFIQRKLQKAKEVA